MGVDYPGPQVPRLMRRLTGRYRGPGLLAHPPLDERHGERVDEQSVLVEAGHHATHRPEHSLLPGAAGILQRDVGRGATAQTVSSCCPGGARLGSKFDGTGQ